MEQSFWRERWQEGRIQFHNTDFEPQLVKFGRKLFGEKKRILVPLCGKSLDLLWLRENTRAEIVGGEWIQTAVEDCFAEHGIEHERGKSFGLPCYRAERLRLYQGDFFDMSRAAYNAGESFDACFDRAALVALPRQMRVAYARSVSRLMSERARMLIVSFEHQAEWGGPPFSVPGDEIYELYDEHWEIEEIHRHVLDAPHLKEKSADGVDFVQVVWSAERRPQKP